MESGVLLVDKPVTDVVMSLSVNMVLKVSRLQHKLDF